jgi:hypothetical protein
MTRLVSRSISRPPPAGSIEGDVDVIDRLDEIFGAVGAQMVPPNGLFENVNTELGSLKDIADAEIRQNKDDVDHYDEDMTGLLDLQDELKISGDRMAGQVSSLKNFKKELDELAEEMEAIQIRSLVINNKLKARKDAEIRLSPLVEALIIPPSIVREIADGEVNAKWRASLQYVVRRRNELESLRDREDLSAVKGVEELIKLLMDRAVERIKEYIAPRIRKLRAAGTNAQAIQRDLLNSRSLFTFLKEHNPQLANDIEKAYVRHMRWYYGAYFNRYIRSLEKLPLHVAADDVLLGTLDDSRSKGGLFARAQVPVHHAFDFFTIGNRAKTIRSDDSSVVTSQAAENSKNSHWIEEPFRSLNQCLADNAAVEHQFLAEFFGLSGAESNAAFSEIFEPTLSQTTEFTDFVVGGTYDAYGILICLRLCDKLEESLHIRNVPGLDEYFTVRQKTRLWKRFKEVMDAHCDSLRRASTKSSSYTGTTSHSSLVPHATTQRFASFVSGILSLSEGKEAVDEPVAIRLETLRNNFEMFLTKASGVLKGHDQEKFLYNNYSLVSTILEVSQSRYASIK